MADLEKLTVAFAQARTMALDYIGKHNDRLPATACPDCGDDGHVPGLRCPACGYRHDVSWVILRDTEWGYDVVPLNDRRKVVVSFKVQDGE